MITLAPLNNGGYELSFTERCILDHQNVYETLKETLIHGISTNAFLLVNLRNVNAMTFGILAIIIEHAPTKTIVFCCAEKPPVRNALRMTRQTFFSTREEALQHVT